MSLKEADIALTKDDGIPFRSQLGNLQAGRRNSGRFSRRFAPQ
ncbi:hypothetical protein ACN2XU_22820 [Primorskyibacter sp. 2E107]